MFVGNIAPEGMSKAKRKSAPAGGQPATTNRIERMEMVRAGDLTRHPDNWKRHPPEQIAALREQLQNDRIGWTGAMLYNEETGRVLDGHGRLDAVDPDELVPVLIGRWGEAEELEILASHDPIGAMAEVDGEALKKLAERLQPSGLWVQELVDQQLGQLAQEIAESGDERGEEESVQEMTLHPFESYDYIVLLFRNSQDFDQACERFAIQRVGVTYPGGKRKVGLGRVIDGATALERLERENHHPQQEPGGDAA